MFEDPAKTLIIERSKLVDALYFRHTAVAAEARTLRLTSLVSRIAYSGHIKHGEDSPWVGRALPEVITFGENRRAALKLGNKRWSVSKKGQYLSPYANVKEPEPRALLRERLKSRFIRGVEKANKYADEFGHDFIYKPVSPRELEQGRTMKRTHPGAFNRKKVVDALTMLRNSYPDQYEAALVQDHLAERKKVYMKVKATKVRTPMPSPITPPPDDPPKRFSIHSHAGSRSFASFVSATTSRVGVRKVRIKPGKVTSIVQKVASKVRGLLRLRRKNGLGEFVGSDSADDLLTCYKTEGDVEGLQEKLDGVDQWVSEHETEADDIKEEHAVAELSVAPSALRGEKILRHLSKEFTIDAGIHLAAKPTPA
jgi:hypothetical protein